ncbi:hypothetical protein RHODGE_RHODGE_04107 [Rhodoplanes serenus]|uniref:General secretion pathway protein GspM n=1 Tax=Rhodoplanes serenus TaxID=200615 RepID=A0A447CZ33_9BRAD|nr:type II secretion system protein GspM [Rhodoplanes serenus]VCU10508.1 hypothetical protein RHODGE_RHODGE_04107 [Rhodoplanes serenus]
MSASRIAPTSAAGRRLATAAYALTVAGLLLVAADSVAGILDRMRTVAVISDLLDRLEARRPTTPGTDIAATAAGDPFLEGTTIAMAGAALLQRVTSAVARAGGTVQSSQVELPGAGSAQGLVSLTASCEMPERMLQAFLYDLEAGMPFLFIDQLVVQAPQTAGGPEHAPTRVLLSVTGRWRGAS